MRTTALELSGGKDSVACLYLMRDLLDDITVYWLNTGDAYPETVRVINECRTIIPHFVEVQSNVAEWKRANGVPSDVVPVTGTCVELPLKDGDIQTVDRYVCCVSNMMLPLHKRVVDDGNTTIIRGQRNDEFHKSSIRSGEVHDNIKFLFPIETWSDDEVFAYLTKVGAPIHAAYATGKHGVDCLHCTGWWEHTNMKLLARHQKAFDYVTGTRTVIERMVRDRLRPIC